MCIYLHVHCVANSDISLKFTKKLITVNILGSAANWSCQKKYFRIGISQKLYDVKLKYFTVLHLPNTVHYYDNS